MRPSLYPAWSDEVQTRMMFESDWFGSNSIWFYLSVAVVLRCHTQELGIDEQVVVMSWTSTRYSAVKHGLRAWQPSWDRERKRRRSHAKKGLFSLLREPKLDTPISMIVFRSDWEFRLSSKTAFTIFTLELRIGKLVQAKPVHSTILIVSRILGVILCSILREAHTVSSPYD